MKRLYKILSLALVCGSVFFYSCETLELDLTENPNALTPGQADVNFYLNSIQEDFVRQLEGDAGVAADNWGTGGFQNGDGFNDFGQTLVRLYNYGSRDYASGIQPGDGDDEWVNAYAGMLIDIKAMNVLAEEANLTHHIAMGQFFQAYTLVVLADFFGDIPVTEALQGAENLNPNLEPGASAYDAAFGLLDLAIANFQAEAAADPDLDIFYNGDWDAWIKAANTLKMKMWLQLRLVDSGAKASFDAIVATGEYIQSTDEDFQYRWPATSSAQPDTRHPRYGLNYQAAGAGDYMSNWLMNLMDTREDPRKRYYFYRQTDAVPGSNDAPPNEETLNCSLETPPPHYIAGGYTFCWLDNGYWGRDHGDDDGIPPDGLLRATWGVYPAGGRFDDDRFAAIAQVTGGQGAGITPILTAMYVDFYKAEFAMASGDIAGARDFMLEGTRKSIAKVQPFAALDPDADLDFEPDAATVDAWIADLGSSFDAANESGKWDVLSEAFWVTSYGNGVEPYNWYRRTGYPTTLQPNLEPDPGTFQRSLWLPNNVVNRNSSVSQKPDQAQPVFWDTNPTAPVAN
jgi:hypothetical protein